jgi:excisionase family DNA binding protein
MNIIAPLPTSRRPGAPWTFEDAATHLQISDRHLRRLADDDKVRTIRLGRRRLLPDTEVQRIAEEGV